jgi:cytoskeleton protein RodZ
MSIHGPDLEDSNEAESLTNIPEGPGASLRAARESKGLSLDDVSKRLRLNKHILENIEANDYRDGTALVFIRGYIRSYAELLKQDTEKALAAFDTLGLSEERDITEFVRPKRSGTEFKIPVSISCKPPILWGSVAAMVLALTGLLWVYVGDGNQLATVTTSAEAEEITELQEVAASKAAAYDDAEEDAAEAARTEPENTVAVSPREANHQAEALLF